MSSNLILDNIFLGTLKNMMFCLNDYRTSKLKEIIEQKGCSVIDCSNDWSSKRRIIVEATNQCVDQCPEDFKFLYDCKCYYRCPEGTYPDNFKCIKDLLTSNYTLPSDNCTIKYYFLGRCNLNLQTNTEKRKFIQSTVNEILRGELYDIVLMAIDYKITFIIREENEIYQIYSLNNKYRNQNLTYIDFGDCRQKLKENAKLDEDDDIIIFKIEYTSPDFKIPIIEYALFGVFGKKRLNIFVCKDMKIMYNIPKFVNNYEEYKFNPDNNYFYDKCLPADSDNIADLTVKDRMDIFNKNNMSLCESICIFKGYSYNNIICECGIKIKFNSFLNVNVSKYNLIYRFEESPSNSLNFWVFKCMINLFSIDIISKNICSIIILVILLAALVGAFLFFLKEQAIMNNKIFMLIETTMKKDDDNNTSENSKNIYFSNDKSIVDKLKIDKERANHKKGTSRILADNMNNNDNKQHNNNSIENIHDKNELMQINKMKECSEYTDNELNNLNYFDKLIKPHLNNIK